MFWLYIINIFLDLEEIPMNNGSISSWYLSLVGIIVNKMIQVFCEEDANKLIANDYKLIKTQLVGNITSYIFALSNKSSFNLNNLKQYRYTNKLYF